MFETLEEKVIAVVLAVLVAIAAAGYFAFHFVDLGKAEANTRIAAAAEVARKHDLDIESNWQEKLDAANQSHLAEMAELRGTIFVLSNPPTPSVRKPHPGSAAVPVAAPAPSGSAAAAEGGGLCSDVLQTPPVELRAEFDAARRADALAADYRLLFNAWPNDLPAPR